MVRAKWTGTLVAALAWAGMTWGQSAPMSPSAAAGPSQCTITVQEQGKPAQKCKVLKAWKQADGKMAYQVQSLDTGEMMTIAESGPAAGSGASGKAIVTRIFHWGKGNVPPLNAPRPPEATAAVAPKSPAPMVSKTAPSVAPAGPSTAVTGGKDMFSTAGGPPAEIKPLPVAVMSVRQPAPLAPAPAAMPMMPPAPAPMAPAPVQTVAKADLPGFSAPPPMPAPVPRAGNELPGFSAPAPFPPPSVTGTMPAPAPTLPTEISPVLPPVAQPTAPAPLNLPEPITPPSVAKTMPTLPTPAQDPSQPKPLLTTPPQPIMVPLAVKGPADVSAQPAAPKPDKIPMNEWHLSWGKPDDFKSGHAPETVLPQADPSKDDPLKNPAAFSPVPHPPGEIPAKPVSRELPSAANADVKSPAKPATTAALAQDLRPAPVPAPAGAPGAPSAGAPCPCGSTVVEDTQHAPRKSLWETLGLKHKSTPKESGSECCSPCQPDSCQPCASECGKGPMSPSAMKTEPCPPCVMKTEECPKIIQGPAPECVKGPGSLGNWKPEPAPVIITEKQFSDCTQGTGRHSPWTEDMAKKPMPMPQPAPHLMPQPESPGVASVSSGPPPKSMEVGKAHVADELVMPAHVPAPPPPPPVTKSAPVGDTKTLVGVLHEALYPSQREWAAESLAGRDYHKEVMIVPELVKAAREDAAAVVRVTCVHCLVKMKARMATVLDTFQFLMSDPDPRVRKAAQEALVEMGGNPDAPSVHQAATAAPVRVNDR